jgi:hypothetical protein
MSPALIVPPPDALHRSLQLLDPFSTTPAVIVSNVTSVQIAIWMPPSTTEADAGPLFLLPRSQPARPTRISTVHTDTAELVADLLRETLGRCVTISSTSNSPEQGPDIECSAPNCNSCIKYPALRLPSFHVCFHILDHPASPNRHPCQGPHF